MQISRMPIPADDGVNSEMSVEANPSDTKSELETATKVVNGDCHKSVNGSTDDDTKESDKAAPVVVKEENIEEQEQSENKTESLAKSTDEIAKNGEAEPEKPEKTAKETNNEEEETTSTVDNLVENDQPKVEPESNKIENEQATPMEVDESANPVENPLDENIVIKEEVEEVEESKPIVTDNVVTLDTEKSVDQGEVLKNNKEVVKADAVETNPVNGEVKLSDEEKNIKVDKVNQNKSAAIEEDVSSEMSADTLSPKQVDEPVARKRSAASHDELSVVSGASSDNDLPKTKKLRSEEDAPLLKDDIRERLIKNIVQSSGKNEVELTRNIDKIQNEIKVITEIAQTKRDELVTLIRLQKLKEEIIERLMIKMKEFDATKTDNSKDWNLPEMFQINLSQPELILSEKNITDIIENRETQLEKPVISNYDQNSYATSTANTSVTSVALSSNTQSNEWILADRANRSSRAQRAILPKPSAAVNNTKEGRQGPILDVKLLIADHRSKNPETVVAKRGRRKAPANEFSVPTSSAPLRYPNPIGFGNPIHHVNDGNFKTTITNSHGVPNNAIEHGSEHSRFKDIPAFPEVTLHPVAQSMQPQQQQQHQQPTSLLHGILTKGAGTHHLPISMANPPTNYSPTLARLLTAPERCKQSRGKQRQTPVATVVSSNTHSRNEITITPVQSTSMSSTYQQKPNITSNIPPPPQIVDDEDASDRLVIDEGQDVMNANSPTNAPQCQGCMQKPAQFVCAGCGNQWYCSKDCQIDAWDDHSEVCSG